MSYYDMRIGYIPVGGRMKDEDGVLRMSGCRVDAPDQAKLRKHLDNSDEDDKCLCMELSDNGINGEGLQLTLELWPALQDGSSRILWLRLEDSAVRLLHSALGSIQAMRAAQHG